MPTIGPMVFGTRWRTMIRLSPAPHPARAASTNSFSPRLMTTPRTSLAVLVQATNVIKVTIKRFDPGSPSTVAAQGCFSGRSRLEDAIIKINNGSPRMRSVNCINPLSTLPPPKPGRRRRRRCQWHTAEIALAIPTKSETRPPQTFGNRGPGSSWSVPNQNWKLGGTRISLRSPPSAESTASFSP